jgi:hypothetical protein
MADLIHDGYAYDVYIRPWKKGIKKYEVVKYVIGYRNLWCNISYTEYLKIKNESKN